ncbi:hypothetical protein FHX34_103482 [Actinoplanes teichomyceticus]|uniref:Uncharacterized protein n=1 Tax=Actinoplanes teichomyceticus TaxID=1867 RepID=A0A561WAS1_ACTTI|nr:hypothetical protein FHX34_103482 [Actinoplanes teichomyceticus]
MGRRGRALLGFAVLDVVWGVRLSTVDPHATAFYTWLDVSMPLWVWSLPWFAVSALCLAQVRSACDRAAYGAAIGIKVGWAALCLGAWLLGGVGDTWPQAAIWTAFAWCVWLMAGWPESFGRKGVAWTPPLP